MKYAHRFDVSKEKLPAFAEKDYFRIALNRLDTSRMSPVDKALYENMLMRARTIADKNQQILEEEKAKVAHALKKEAVKNALSMGLLTVEQVAVMLSVSVDFVKQVKRNLLAAEKRKQKKQESKK